MKASEIITDDILSRERRRANDIVGHRNPDKRHQFWTPEQRLKYDQLDKFVPRAIDKLRNGPVEEDVDEPIKVLFGILKSGNRQKLINFLHAHQELKGDPAYRTAEKILDTWEKIGADTGKYKSSPQFTFEESLDNTLNMTAFEDSLDSKYTICAPGSRQPTMIFHTREEAEENLKRAPKGSTVELVVPKKKTGSQMMGEEWEIKEAAQSMRQAARNPQGAKFGGYYRAKQKGPPKKGQGFGSA